MLEPPIAVRLVRGKTRCHPHITDLQTFYAVTTTAIEAQLGIINVGTSHMVLAARAAQADVALPLNGYVEAAVSGQPPDEIIVRIEDKKPEPDGIDAAGMTPISTRLVSAEFALFVETGNEWLRQNFGKQVSDWPPVSNFCRVVRNAIVHGGRINLNSETAVGGAWRHLKYDHRHNGKPILNDGDLSKGDLLILMLEMEQELNEVGAPFDLG
jgi:hypothetical protein